LDETKSNCRFSEWHAGRGRGERNEGPSKGHKEKKSDRGENGEHSRGVTPRGKARKNEETGPESREGADDIGQNKGKGARTDVKKNVISEQGPDGGGEN